MTGLHLVDEVGLALRVSYGEQELLRYVYTPWDPQLESPKPYFHPLRTLGGELVSLYRPHDHVWHKGIAWSLPNVDTANFWGGPTYRRDRGYEQLRNDGSMVHRGFDRQTVSPDRVEVAQTLDWVTEQGETWFAETRSWAVTVAPQAWCLTFSTSFSNVADRPLTIGSPTTEGRENAGYGGLFWRGPRSFSGGTVLAPGKEGGDELMGVNAPWLGYTGRHDESGRSSTLVFVDAPDNAGHPCRWFVRTGIYACLCPAPFFSEETVVAPGQVVGFRYAVVIADGAHDPDGAEELAVLGRASLT